MAEAEGFSSTPAERRLALAQGAGNHLLAWARLHLHPICAARVLLKSREVAVPGPVSWQVNTVCKSVARPGCVRCLQREETQGPHLGRSRRVRGCHFLILKLLQGLILLWFQPLQQPFSQRDLWEELLLRNKLSGEMRSEICTGFFWFNSYFLSKSRVFQIWYFCKYQ